jgi:hypothetical protein
MLSVAFSPDGKQIVSGSSDCIVLRLGCSEWPAHRIKEVIESSWDQVKLLSPDGKQVFCRFADARNLPPFEHENRLLTI